MSSVKLFLCVLALVCADVVTPLGPRGLLGRGDSDRLREFMHRRWLGWGRFGETDGGHGDEDGDYGVTTTLEPHVTTTADPTGTSPTEKWGNFEEESESAGLATKEHEVTSTEDDSDGSGGESGDGRATNEPEVTSTEDANDGSEGDRLATKEPTVTTKTQPPRETTTAKPTDSLFRNLAQTTSTVDCIKKCIRQDKAGLSEFLNVIDSDWDAPTEENGNFVDNNVEKPTTPQCSPPATTTKKPIEEPPSSCKELLGRNKFLPNGPYKLQNKDTLEVYRAYCHMTEIPNCGPGGWTLAMKIDGKKNFFNYESDYWTNEEPFAVRDGLEGLTEKQTKLASYWNTPFNKICLGMKRNNVTKWTAVDYEASSLYNVIAGDPSYTRTHAGRTAWASLIDGSHLQDNCNKEGFNIHRGFYWGSYGYLYMNVRIGLVANNEDDCRTPDSCIGFGTSIRGCNDDLRRSTCGNFGVCGWIDNRDDTAFGYILVQ